MPTADLDQADFDQAVILAGEGKRDKFAVSEPPGMGMQSQVAFVSTKPDHRYFYGIDAVRFCAATLSVSFYLAAKPIALTMPAIRWGHSAIRPRSFH
jgi:hypothetical protein